MQVARLDFMAKSSRSAQTTGDSDARLSERNAPSVAQASVGDAQIRSSNSAQTPATAKQTRYLMVLDLWERIVNFRSAFIQLALIAQQANLILVEPFVFEAKVQHAMRVPEHFSDRGQNIQTLSTYFDTTKLYEQGAMVSYPTWATQAAVLLSTDQHNSSRASWEHVSRLSALAVFVWAKDLADGDERLFWWCDGHSAFGASYPSVADEMRRLSPHVVFERTVCINGKVAVESAEVDLAFFDDLFGFVEAGLDDKDGSSRAHITIAFENYRKLAFETLARQIRTQSGAPVDSMLRLSPFAYERAALVLDSLRHSQQAEIVIAIHLRAGRAMKQAAALPFSEDESSSVHRPSVLVKWAESCIAKLALEVDKVRGRDAERVAYYVASDIFNDGMKGGESPINAGVSLDLDAIRSIMGSYFPDMHVLDLDALQLNRDQSDVMGLSSLTDMAVCARADHFISMRDSFAKLVVAERTAAHPAGSSIIIDCAFEPDSSIMPP